VSCREIEFASIRILSVFEFVVVKISFLSSIAIDLKYNFPGFALAEGFGIVIRSFLSREFQSNSLSIFTLDNFLACKIIVSRSKSLQARSFSISSSVTNENSRLLITVLNLSLGITEKNLKSLILAVTIDVKISSKRVGYALQIESVGVSGDHAASSIG